MSGRAASSMSFHHEFVDRESGTWIRMISAPASASAVAAARPIPLVAPVINAVCPSKENIFAVAVPIFAIESRILCQL